MGSQTIELKWANHKSNMTSELQELYLTDALLDVTIACGEFSLKAHKTVLSASSTFFRKLFLDNPCKHPILIMTDIDFDDLKTMMGFMYQGEVHISQEKLSRFLKTADRLKIKGLCSIEDMNVNPFEQPQIDVDSHYASSSREHVSNYPQVQDIFQVENVQNSSEKLTDCTQSSASKEKPTVKVEHELQSPVNDDCMYWQSECFDQASSSSALSVCTVPAIPSVPHQQSTSSVSHQLSIPKPVSHQQTATSSVSHQLSNLSDPHQLANPSVSHQLGVPLSGESSTNSESHTDSSTQAQVQEECTGRDVSSTSKEKPLVKIEHELQSPVNDDCMHWQSENSYSECHTDCSTQAEVQEEGTGRDVIPVNLYQSQNQSSISFPTSAKPSFDVVESLNSLSSSQGGKTDFTPLPEEKQEVINILEASTKMAERNLDSLPYRCDVCGKKFLRRDTLEKHLHLHDPLNKFICTVCNYRFNCRKELTRHFRTHSGERPYKCSICQKQFSQQSSLNYHQRIHTGEKPYECSICQRRFSQQSNLKCHRRMHTGERPYQCIVCQKCFKTISGLRKHELFLHSGEKPYQCTVCHKCFKTRSDLRNHERLHTGERPYQCTFCQKCFQYSSAVRRHERSHIGERPYKSQVSEFTPLPEEKQEIINIPEASTRSAERNLGSLSYQCDFCGKKFLRKDTLEKHLHLHDPLNKFVCKVCNYRFDCRQVLIIHLRTHSRELLYKCIVCQKQFSHQSSLSRHQRTHTEKMPYKCSICQKRFSQLSHLNYHQRTHTGEKPYQCTVCHKYFRQSSTLRKHELLHTGEKPYQCTVCHKLFRQSSTLKKHERLHTGERPYQCIVCQKCFKTNSSLRKHERFCILEKDHTSAQFASDASKSGEI